MASKFCFQALDKTLKDVMSTDSNSKLIFGGKGGRTDVETKEIDQFSKWLLKLGEGRLCEPNDGHAEIDIPREILIEQFDDPIVAIVDSTYLAFLDNHRSFGYLKSRAILASTIEVVDQINNHVLNMMPGESKEYYSSNSVDHSEIHDNSIMEVLTPEFLSSLRTSGLPNHIITLKVGTPIMRMRNIDQSEGLYNGTRLIVTKMANHVLEAE
ncbi:uncharacterized protein LOC131659275 [Vicia villosa]|uniref:uncharacterized protein LOC131659275 n=1 Tax=Vicia villosa TaxID=3911 RepID=UPI00273C4FF7|nr:uncharacterized protein LOC131659275 [Vicia villosa]